MDSGRPSSRSKISRQIQKVIHLNKKKKNTSAATKSRSHGAPGFCLLIPQEKLKCCELSREFEREEIEDAAKEMRTRAAMEAFIAKLFATISSFKAAYAELQMAQFPYNGGAIQSADQAVVDELRALSELKQSFMKKRIDFSPPHVTLMLAEIQEQQSLMKTYEITMKKMQNEIETKEGLALSFRQGLSDIADINRSLEKKLNASGSFSILDNVRFSEEDANTKDFILVLQYALRSIRNFVKVLIREMESANWDTDSAANSIQPDVNFPKKDHKGFAFESFVCREIFSGFNTPFFSLQIENLVLPNGNHQKRLFFFEQFRKVKSVSVIHFLKQNPSSLLGKFLKAKYLQLVHPKMEFSFCGNLNQRKMVNAGESPETEFFRVFAEMGRRVWLLHCLSLSFDQEVSVFQVRRNCRYSEVYMESVTDDAFAVAGEGEFRAAFTVVPGFRVGKLVVQSQVYLSCRPRSAPKT